MEEEGEGEEEEVNVNRKREWPEEDGKNERETE